MKDAKNALRIVGMLLLGVFVFVVVVPFVLSAVGFVISSLIALAVLAIKVAVVVAIGYLILVGIRALLR